MWLDRSVLLSLKSALSFSKRSPRPTIGTGSGVNTTRRGLVGKSEDMLGVVIEVEVVLQFGGDVHLY